MSNEVLSAADRYKQLAVDREPYLRTARDCAKLTLPFIMPPEGAVGQKLDTPYQSVGARGVNNLAAKLLLALFPPNSPFFKLAVDQFELKKIARQPNVKTKLDEALSEMEQATLTEFETSAARPTVSESLVHLIISGNGLVEVPTQGSLKFYRLDRYVVQRDPMGTPCLIIIHESVAPSTLPPEFLKKIKGENPLTGKKEKKQDDTSSRSVRSKNIDLYTVVERLSAERWQCWQEVKGHEVPGSYTTYKNESLPFIPLRFIKIDGEDYGRGLVEQNLGDLISLEGLSQSLLDGAQAAARVVFLVNPNGVTDADECAKADNGAFIAGREEDVKPLQLGKFYDFKTAAERADRIEARLNAAFLVLAGVQRDAERVTAEEIRALIQELETSLGGVYSVLAQEFQLPLASAFMARMARDSRLPKLPGKIVKPTITTGVEALGRGNDLQKLDLFVKDIGQTFGPQALATYVSASEYMARRAAALGINVKGLVKTEEEVSATAEQQVSADQMQSLAEKVAPAAAKAALTPQG